MKKFISIVIVIVFIFTGCKDQDNQTEYTNEEESGLGNKAIDKVVPSQPYLQCNYHDDREFKQSVELAKNYNLQEKIYGGIVPHHLLARQMIGDFFHTIANEDTEVVVVVGPNHKGIGVSDVYTGEWSWQTPYGILETDQDIINQLTINNIANMDFELLENEHSISSLVPYIKYYFPNSKLVPILISGTSDLDETIDLGKKIHNIVEGRSFLVIASVDFSHYLPVWEADEKDVITLDALENRKIDQISFMDNDYMDSPPSIITLLTIMNESRMDKHKLLDHNNSARINEHTDKNETTSYFTMVYYQ